jgi:hypothetical protein
MARAVGFSMKTGAWHGEPCESDCADGWSLMFGVAFGATPGAV